MVIAGCNGGGDSIGDVMKDCGIHVDGDSGDKVKEDRVAGDECFGVGDDNSGNDCADNGDDGSNDGSVSTEDGDNAGSVNTEDGDDGSVSTEDGDDDNVNGVGGDVTSKIFPIHVHVGIK